MCYILDIDELGIILKEIGSKISNPDTQFDRINNLFEQQYGIKLPEGTKRASIEKFGDIVAPSHRGRQTVVLADTPAQ